MADEGGWAFTAGRLTGAAWRRARRLVGGRKPGRAKAAAKDPDLERWYANLEIPYGSDLETVRRARKRLLARYHPDRYATDPDAARRAHELVLAIHHAHDQLVKRLTR